MHAACMHYMMIQWLPKYRHVKLRNFLHYKLEVTYGHAEAGLHSLQPMILAEENSATSQLNLARAILLIELHIALL